MYIRFEIIDQKKKYRSYRGEVGKIAPILLERDFASVQPCQKWATDVTGFKVGNKKLHLSPIIELFNGEIIRYNLSESPNFEQVALMVKDAFKKIKWNTSLRLHSDQGLQYQMKEYQRM